MTSSNLIIAQSLLEKLRHVEKKMCWLEGYMISNSSTSDLIELLESNSNQLRALELKLIKLIDKEEKNEQAIYTKKKDT